MDAASFSAYPGMSDARTLHVPILKRLLSSLQDVSDTLDGEDGFSIGSGVQPSPDSPHPRHFVDMADKMAFPSIAASRAGTPSAQNAPSSRPSGPFISASLLGYVQRLEKENMSPREVANQNTALKYAHLK